MTPASRIPSAWILALMIGAGLAGCEKEGPFERAGEEVDETVDDARQKVDDAADEMRE